jgi:hypothetical protein
MDTETLPLDPWLRQFSPQAQPLVTAWFGYAVTQGAQSPEGVLEIVARVCGRKLEWSTTPATRELCSTLLLALCHQRAKARAYAASLLQQQELV